MKSEAFVYRDTLVSFRQLGSGRPVLLLHGFGEDSRIFDDLLAEWTKNALLVVPDLPGSGKSGFDQAVCSHLGEMGQCMQALMQHLGFSTYGVLGHSMGGYIALAMAEAFPGCMEKMGLLHSTAFADSEAKKETRQQSVEFIGQHGPAAFLATAIPGLFAPSFAKGFPEKVNQLIAQGSSFSADALMAYTRAMMTRPDRSALLKMTGIPTLFVMGTEDKAAPMQDVLQQSHLPAHSLVRILRGIGHMGMLEDPEAFSAAVISFLKLSH
jgi:pimeloyl-ACP methyl ester carboxylesterase